jgi:glycolate oxidase
VDVSLSVADDIKAHLIIEVDGNDPDALFKDCERITEVMNEYGASEVLFADTAQQKAELWKMRRATGEAIKSHSVYKEEDTVVPRAELAVLLKGVKEIGLKYGFRSICYGHAGDGNLHVNIIKEEMNDEDWNQKVPLGIREIFQLCVQLGGTISGEHGIGWVQKDYMNIAFDEVQLNLQKGIKKLFDPNMILNPGKMFH